MFFLCATITRVDLCHPSECERKRLAALQETGEPIHSSGAGQRGVDGPLRSGCLARRCATRVSPIVGLRPMALWTELELCHAAKVEMWPPLGSRGQLVSTPLFTERGQPLPFFPSFHRLHVNSLFSFPVRRIEVQSGSWFSHG